MTRKKLFGIGSAVIIAGVFAYLLLGGLGENLVYFLTPQELLAREERGIGVPVRLGGQVAPGSVQWNAEAIDLRFRLTDGVKEVVVHAKSAPPAMFRDGQGVVVEGRYGRDGVFTADQLMVKHNEEYRAPKAGEKPSEMYRSLMRQATPQT
ncbi:MAG TPA: cytochrome c maturation protein CcmE [Gemmatimonadaceae bacterium]|nr:cytochrome c maturation protein CcmE [Gemmatimonadaceae bacterium]